MLFIHMPCFGIQVYHGSCTVVCPHIYKKLQESTIAMFSLKWIHKLYYAHIYTSNHIQALSSYLFKTSTTFLNRNIEARKHCYMGKGPKSRNIEIITWERRNISINDQNNYIPILNQRGINRWIQRKQRWAKSGDRRVIITITAGKKQIVPSFIEAKQNYFHKDQLEMHTSNTEVPKEHCLWSWCSI